MNHRRFILTIIVVALGLLALRVPVNTLVGADARFTLFDLWAPTLAAFLGLPLGLTVIGATQILNTMFGGATTLTAVIAIRFVTPLFAASYFARKNRFFVVLPLVAIAAFILHPVGYRVWYFSLYWLIPIFCWFVHDRSLLARSFGATFTAHAVGGALWIYIVPMPASAWTGLIPIVAFERTIFAVGILLSFVILTNIAYLLGRTRVPFLQHLPTDHRYVWKWTEALARP